jgi:TIR domain
MPRIFISHSSDDTDLADQIAGDLRCAGYEPWIDRQSIRAGNPIVAGIDAAIMSCHYFVVILSQKALESEWVNQEIIEGLWQKLSERRRKHIIPALREACVVPLHLRHIRYADFTSGYAVGFAQIYAAIDLPPAEDRWPIDLIPADQLVSIEHDTGNQLDHIRFACAHTIWSIRPDRAKPFLQSQLGDWRDYVNRHARLLLERYF